ncbi:hypothetical protein Fmac_013904 [Flemingia macrophylla]|uniref:Uncharacterized protein n=1 Tax=Flemingia macrophylla TaxID=520843 RepID=A0ABD1MA81_9FABA
MTMPSPPTHTTNIAPRFSTRLRQLPLQIEIRKTLSTIFFIHFLQNLINNKCSILIS